MTTAISSVPRNRLPLLVFLVGLNIGFICLTPLHHSTLTIVEPEQSSGNLQSRHGHHNGHHHHHQHQHHKRPTSAANKGNGGDAVAGSGGNGIEGNVDDPPLLAASAKQQFADCDYYQNLVADKSYDIYSPGYALASGGNSSSRSSHSNYPPDTQCRWLAVAPKGHTIRMHCSDVELPRSTNCIADRLEISGAGRADLADAKRFCGIGSFVSDSNVNKLSIALRTDQRSRGGRFRCTLAAIRLPPGTLQYCQCGIRNRNRIVGGMETGVNEFPMMAGLIQNPTVSVFCGATIIARNYALTAAHCVVDRPADQLGLLVGDHNYRTSNETRYAALYRIAELIVHQRYNVQLNLNDIALVRTDRMMQFNEGVSAVCLPFKYAIWQEAFVGASVLALGWGTQEFGGPLSPYLQEVGLSVIENRQCTQAYSESQITAAQICTYRPEKDTCQSDSGGPLLYTDAGNYLMYLVGTVAYGNGCASTDPGVNMRTTSYLGWIQAYTPGTMYCFR